MARLVNVWRDDDPVELASKQMPLVVDENLTVSARARPRARDADFPDRRDSRGTSTATSFHATERIRVL